MDQAPENSREELESRRSKASQRQRTLLRRAYYAAGVAMLKVIMRLLWRSYRIETVIGAEIEREIRASESPCAPCFWHGEVILCTGMAYRWIKEDRYKLSFVVTPSVDGDVPAKFGEALGAKVLRGSKNSSGAKVLRDMRRMLRSGYSIFTAADGPRGPEHHFKEGVVLMARVANVPMIPLGFACDRAWHLRRWDHFTIPKPFARIAIGIGKPVLVPKSTSVRELEPWRAQMELAIDEQSKLARAVFELTPE